jgi:hypothetical protein
LLKATNLFLGSTWSLVLYVGSVGWKGIVVLVVKRRTGRMMRMMESEVTGRVVVFPKSTFCI